MPQLLQVKMDLIILITIHLLNLNHENDTDNN